MDLLQQFLRSIGNSEQTTGSICKARHLDLVLLQFSSSEEYCRSGAKKDCDSRAMVRGPPRHDQYGQEASMTSLQQKARESSTRPSEVEGRELSSR